MRVTGTIGVLAACGLLAGGCTPTHSGVARSPASALPAIRKQVTLEDDSETFRPLGGSPPPGSLSVAKAWSKYRVATLRHPSALPPGTRVGYGELTQTQPRKDAGEQRVFAYSLRATCTSTLRVTRADRRCREWLFLNPRTAVVVHSSPAEPGSD